MSAKPDAVMRSWFEEVWNQGREDAIDRIFAADGMAHGLPGGTMRGPDGFRPLFTAFRGAFPDIHIEVERTITEGELVAAHCRVTGTHTGKTLGLAPTGQRVDFQGITIARIVEGKFSRRLELLRFPDDVSAARRRAIRSGILKLFVAQAFRPANGCRVPRTAAPHRSDRPEGLRYV